MTWDGLSPPYGTDEELARVVNAWHDDPNGVARAYFVADFATKTVPTLLARLEAAEARQVPDGWVVEEGECRHHDPTETHQHYRLKQDPPVCEDHRLVPREDR